MVADRADPVLRADVPRLSIVVPTFNERLNVGPLLCRLDAALDGIAWEAIFVDDNSADETWKEIRQLAATDPRVRCIRRIGRRGLSGACIEGMLSSSAPIVAVIDADLQHDETKLREMFAEVSDGKADLVVGSRYMSGGSSAGFSDFRQRISRLTTAIAQRMLRVTVTDPMSGFFMIRRDRFEEISPHLSVHGFKVLLDVIVSSGQELRVTEVPYTFRSRLHGESKLDALVALDFVGLILAKLTNDVVSLRFVLFGLVGTLGLLVHLTALYVGLSAFDLTFGRAQVFAALLAIVSNFLINNRLTYRDQRLRGLGMLRGFVLFCVVSSIGFLANVGVAFAVYESDRTWWSAGAAGSLIGLVWNYAMSNVLVWRAR